MVKFIFEDSEFAPVSHLLAFAYDEGRVFFSNGNSRIIQKLNKVYNTDDFFIIFMDVPPNNKAIVRMYKQYADTIRLKFKNNVVIVPIICIEYFVLNMLLDYGLCQVSSSFEQLKRCLLVDKDVSVGLNYECSVEKLYKSLLNNQSLGCLPNKQKYGEFYKFACPCSRVLCGGNVSLDLFDKSVKLWGKLPVFDDVFKSSLDKDVSCHHADISDILLNVSKSFESLCNQLNVPVFGVELFQY